MSVELEEDEEREADNPHYDDRYADGQSHSQVVAMPALNWHVSLQVKATVF